MAQRLQHKIAIVFGASRGIGRATVEAFAAEGATVIGADVQDAEPVVGGPYQHHLLDVTNETAVDLLVDDVLAEHGRVDVAFLNVGTHLAKSLTQTTVAEFNRLIEVNLLSAFLGARAVLRPMLAQGSGSLIFISSNGGVMGRPGDPVYNATKHATVGLVRSIAVAHAHEGIRANAIAPGAIDTDLLRSIVPTGRDLDEPEIVRAFVASTPAARVGLPAEVAAAAVLLASDEATFINGATIPVDGAKSAGALPNSRYTLDFPIAEGPDRSGA